VAIVSVCILHAILYRKLHRDISPGLQRKCAVLSM